MTCEQLRISRNRAYIEYERESDTAEKMAKLHRWKALCLMYEDAYRQEIKGEPARDLSTIGSIEEQLNNN